MSRTTFVETHTYGTVSVHAVMCSGVCRLQPTYDFRAEGKAAGISVPQFIEPSDLVDATEWHRALAELEARP